ncbi:MAG: hypothetical protein PCFJNLEI_00657 [Verrucomicrobiae bacterium]|nr:hypothetical protein [Verrucomicrobiae bacterium]
MNNRKTARRFLHAGLALIAAPAFAAAEQVTLTFDQPQTAGISGFRALWDTPVVLSESGMVHMVLNDRFGSGVSAIWEPSRRLASKKGKNLEFGTWSGNFWAAPKASPDVPGALVFDAVHRSLLVRFPGSAEALAAKMKEGYQVEKVELVLPYRSTELWAEGYRPPSGMSFAGPYWATAKFQWHAVAWMLRRPWVADEQIGPTYNAFINGAGFWAKYGAQDPEEDRFPTQFGPAEVSSNQPLGRLDVTAAVTDVTFGRTTGERLRALEENGFLVRKWELYDVKDWRNGYEWGTASGGRGILVQTPRLEVVLARGKKQTVKLPAPADLGRLAAQLKSDGRGGKPTALMPSATQIAGFVEKFKFAKPAWMPEWQWQRVQELYALGGARALPSTPEAFGRWIDGLLSVPPRAWSGFDAVERTQETLLYSEAMPEPVLDHQKLYWTAWLMPDRDISELVQGYIGGDKAQEYYQRTRDWRGNFSVYRTYVHAMGTMNFNHWATAGVLLGGKIIGSEKMMAEGRRGLEQWPLRTWCWFDGSTQESIDHYYFAHSLTAQKVFADLGPSHLDQMMGESILAKSVEELTSSYHPGLRRFIASSSRTGIAYLLTIQDGLQYIIHTLSRNGALTDVGNPVTPGSMPAIGTQLPPGLVAQQTLNGPWAPEWLAGMVDDKPLPYEMTVNYKMWGKYAQTPLWRRTYLGNHYGLACLDVAVQNETVPAMAQWRRTPAPVTKSEELGTLIVRYGINDTELLDSIFRGSTSRNPNGYVGAQGGHTVALQHHNKLILLTSPYDQLQAIYGRPIPKDIFSLQTTIGLFNFQPNPSWEMYFDEKRVAEFPAAGKIGQRITIRDGVSYIGLIPIPGTDLGRNQDVVIKPGGAPVEMQGGGKIAPTLLIEAYNFKADQPMNTNSINWKAVDQAYGGFVIEMGDATEYKDFADFQKHIRETKLELRWDAAAATLHLVYRSAGDTLELGYRPEYAGNWDRQFPTDQVFPYRRVNGAWPYLPEGIDRDSTLTQQGRAGRLEKNGAVLTSAPGKMMYIQTDPKSGTYAALNPFPDPAPWVFSVPGGVSIEADGLVSMTRALVRPGENRFQVDYAVRADQHDETMATAMLLFGLQNEPIVEFNGQPRQTIPVEVDGRKAFVLPLAETPAADMVATAIARYRRGK